MSRTAGNEPRYTAMNLLRIGYALVTVVVSFQFDRVYETAVTGGFAFLALVWFLLTEFAFDERRYPRVAYLPTGLDVLIMTAVIYFSGTANSPLAAGYVYATALSSLNMRISQGFFAAITGTTCYTTVILAVYFGWLPPLNAFGGQAEVGTANLIFALIVVLPCIWAAYFIVHNLTKRNAELLQEQQRIGGARNKFLAKMSHDIRTPLNSLLGSVDLLNESELTADQRMLLSSAQGAAANLHNLVENVLDLVKTDAGELQLEAEPFRLHEVLNVLQEYFQPPAREKGLRFTREDRQLPASMLYGDARRLTHILYNLLHNAVRYTENGHVLLRAQCADPEPHLATLIFTVEDSGQGFAEKQQILLDPGTEPMVPDGLGGLGLVMVRRLVGLMDGEFIMSDAEGGGTRCTVRLRFPIVPESIEVAYESRPLRILVADDAVENRALLGRYLEKSGHAITFAENGRAAVDEYVKASLTNSYDLVLMDIQMPQLDGYGATRAIRESESAGARERTPIIALTAHAMREDASRAIAAGCDYYLTKPVTRRTLLEIIEIYSRKAESSSASSNSRSR